MSENIGKVERRKHLNEKGNIKRIEYKDEKGNERIAYFTMDESLGNFSPDFENGVWIKVSIKNKETLLFPIAKELEDGEQSVVQNMIRIIKMLYVGNKVEKVISPPKKGMFHVKSTSKFFDWHLNRFLRFSDMCP